MERVIGVVVLFIDVAWSVRLVGSCWRFLAVEVRVRIGEIVGSDRGAEEGGESLLCDVMVVGVMEGRERGREVNGICRGRDRRGDV